MVYRAVHTCDIGAEEVDRRVALFAPLLLNPQSILNYFSKKIKNKKAENILRKRKKKKAWIK